MNLTVILDIHKLIQSKERDTCSKVQQYQYMRTINQIKLQTDNEEKYDLRLAYFYVLSSLHCIPWISSVIMVPNDIIMT